MSKRYFLLTVMLFGGVIILSGCGKSLSDQALEKAIEKAAGGKADVNLNDGNLKMNVNGLDIQSGNAVSLPADFPKDVYVIDGKIVSFVNNVEQKSYNLYLQADLGTQETYELYNGKLIKDGWKVTSMANFGGNMSLTLEKEKRILSVIVSASEGTKTMIILAETPKV